jgi:HEAT repeat protein
MYRTPRPVLARPGALLGALLGGLLLAGPAAGDDAHSFLDRSLAGWLSQLNDSRARPAVRRSAAFAIGRLGHEAFLAVPDLARHLRQDKDAGVRDMAAAALGEVVLSMRDREEPFDVTARWGEAGQALRKALTGDTDARVRRSCAYAVGAFGPAAAEAVPDLKKALRDDSPAVRQNAAWALGRVGAADGATVAELCDLLRDANALVRRDAAGALGELGRERAADAARPLFEALKREPDGVVRRTSLDALARLAAPEHAAWAPDLYPLLKSKDPELARGVAFVLGNMKGEPARRAREKLREALRDPDHGIQALAAAGLANVGPAAAAAVPELAAALRASRDPEVRRKAAEGGEEQLRQLAEVGRNAALALANIGEDSRPAVDDLAAALKPLPGAPRDPLKRQPYEEARLYAAEALGRIRYPGNKRAIPALVAEAARRDDNQVIRQRSIFALVYVTDLQALGVDKALLPVLDEKPVRDPDPARSNTVARYDAARVLARGLGERAPDKVADVLVEMMQDDDLFIYLGTSATIKGTGTERGSGESGTRAARGADGRFMGALSLAHLGARASGRPEIVKALREAAKDKSASLAKAAKETLKELKVE